MWESDDDECEATHLDWNIDGGNLMSNFGQAKVPNSYHICGSDTSIPEKVMSKETSAGCHLRFA